MDPDAISRPKFHDLYDVSDRSDDDDRKRSKATGNTVENDDPRDAPQDIPGGAKQRARASNVRESKTLDSASPALRLPIRDGDNSRYQHEIVLDSTPPSAPHTLASRTTRIHEAGSSKTEVDVRTPDGQAATHPKLSSVPATKEHPLEISDSGSEDGSEAATESDESDASDDRNADASPTNSQSFSEEEGQADADGSVDEKDGDISEDEKNRSPNLSEGLEPISDHENITNASMDPKDYDIDVGEVFDRSYLQPEAEGSADNAVMSVR